MRRKKRFPDDVKKICLALVQGYERLGVTGIERSCFYERRTKFLEDIAKYMELVQ